MRRHVSHSRAFTLVEVIVIVTIIGILAAIIAPRLLGRVGQSRTAVAKANAESLASSMSNYIVDCGTPESGASVSVLWERPAAIAEDKWRGPYVNNAEALKDPWGKEFVLRIPGEHNVDFDIVSYGKDGEPGGSDEDADIVHGKK
jgi:general secretion pathway protein G